MNVMRPRMAVAKVGTALILIAVALPLLTHPFQNVPYFDDWTYAWAVENLLNTGTVRILDWSTHINVAQILWGALFCLPFGFSFAALRLSTWVLAIFGLAGFYLLLRELGISERDSLIGTAVLGLTPMYVLLSFSFMTDIPSATFLTWSTYFFLRYLNTNRSRYLVACSLSSVLAIATRLLGIAVAVAVAAYVILQKNPKIRRIRALVVAGVIPVLFTAALIYWHAYHTEYRIDLTWVAGSPQNRTFLLRLGFLRLPQWLVVTTMFAAPPLGLLVSPLVIGSLQRLHFRKAILPLAVVTFATVVAIATGWQEFREHGANWHLVDLGGSRNLVPGSPFNASLNSGAIAGISGALLFSIAAGMVLSTRRKPSATFLRWLLLVQAGPVVILWLWYARYLLAFMPALIALMLLAAPIRRPRAAIALIAVSAVLAVGALHDEVQYNRALWAGVNYLLEAGAPIQQIHGGYVVNGWLQYAHPQNAKVNELGELQVQMINVENGDYNYKLANFPDPSWNVIREIPYPSWLRHASPIYVLKRPGT